ncbi:DUF5615 family PIN-like protein [Panacagrimonas sp.]|uniref:DUF5615 family PIN-like protein n=1 Tax=Panacagrimonas sp. TaxID=2480088 RepID=UPI003B51FCE2
MKLLLDMNLSPRWRDFLVPSGHQVRHWSEVGNVTASDLEIMAVARASQEVDVTNDLDFGALLAGLTRSPGAARGGVGREVAQPRVAPGLPLRHRKVTPVNALEHNHAAGKPARQAPTGRPPGHPIRRNQDSRVKSAP